ncbi:MAG: hypothetical protein Q9182_005838 [Xanthomendoza sp. 2 TL-2023]
MASSASNQSQVPISNSPYKNEVSADFAALPNNPITIKHPGYPEVSNHNALNVLMQLPGVDCVNGKTGIHYGTVLLACSIVSGQKNGLLSRDRNQTDIQLAFDDLLVGGVYYYFVPNEPHYAIYASFRHWAFPHGCLPRGWDAIPRSTPIASAAVAQSTSSGTVLRRDGQCVVSGRKDIIERAHLCPRQETVWFRMNGMKQYNVTTTMSYDSTIDDMANLVALRQDLHTALDKKQMFGFVVKEGRWKVHFLRPSNGLGSEFQNTSVALHEQVAPEHVLTRFAWALFPLVRSFLEDGPNRWLFSLVTDEAGEIHVEKNLMDRATITKTFFPKKKDLGQDAAPEPQSGLEMGQENKKQTTTAARNAKLHDLLDPAEPSSLSTSESTDDSISITTASLDPATKAIQEGILQYNYENDGINDPDPRVHRFYLGEDRLDRLRRLELKRRRPYHNPKLICCDYDKNEKLFHAAIKEEAEWDAYTLCDECLGGEYERRASDLDEGEDSKALGF